MILNLNFPLFLRTDSVPFLSSQEAKPEPSSSSTTSAVATLSKAADITTAELIPLLSKDVVTDLVLVSMLFLPKTMPSHFQETFTPIAAAGGKAQVAHLARLMATQMTNAGIGSGVEKVKQVRFIPVFCL